MATKTTLTVTFEDPTWVSYLIGAKEAESYVLRVGQPKEVGDYTEAKGLIETTPARPTITDKNAKSLSVDFSWPESVPTYYWIGYYAGTDEKLLLHNTKIDKGSLYEIKNDGNINIHPHDPTDLTKAWIPADSFGIKNSVPVSIVLSQNHEDKEPAGEAPGTKKYRLFIPGLGKLRPKPANDVVVWFENLALGDDDVDAGDQGSRLVVKYKPEDKASKTVAYPKDWEDTTEIEPLKPVTPPATPPLQDKKNE